MIELFIMKIEPSKFAVMFLGGFVICAASLFCCLEISNGYDNFINHNSGLKLSNYPYEIHSFESARIVFLYLGISAVFWLRGLSQVVALAVQAIAVSVVNLYFWIRNPKNNAVHLEINSYSFSSGRYTLPSFRIPRIAAFMGLPFPLIEPFVIRIVNGCKLAFCKWDLFCHSVFLKTKCLLLRGSSTKQKADSILARFHLLDPSEIYLH